VQAAVVAEFEDDTEAVKALVAAAKTGQFDHTAQRLRDARDEATRRAEIEAALRDAGVAVVERPTWQSTAKNLDDLRTPDGDALTADNHAACPGHGAYVTTLHGYVDPTTGEPLDQATVTDEDDVEDAEEDGAGYDEDDCCTGCGAHISQPHDPGCAQAPGQDETGEHGQDGQAADEPDDAPPEQAPAAGREWRSYLGARYVCTNPKAHGHVDRYASNGSGYDCGSARKTAAEMTDAEREAARAQRRDVIESNKAWSSAETVRQQWLRAFLTRKTPPKGAGAFLAATLTADAHLVSDTKAADLTDDLLGLGRHTGYGHNPDLLAAIGEASDARAQVLALARVLAGCEAATGKHSWRNVSAHTVRYLRFIQAQGYTLSPVERRAIGEHPTTAEPTA
jgi:ParB family chromosome partitioning protein